MGRIIAYLFFLIYVVACGNMIVSWIIFIAKHGLNPTDHPSCVKEIVFTGLWLVTGIIAGALMDKYDDSSYRTHEAGPSSDKLNDDGCCPWCGAKDTSG